MGNFWKWVRRSVSPVFLTLLVASFILWYIAKLGYTYTTEQNVQIQVDGQPIEVVCVVEGLGANLFGYRIYANKTLRIPLAELTYQIVSGEDGKDRVAIDPQSLQNAISVRYSDIKVLSVGTIPEIEIPENP